MSDDLSLELQFELDKVLRTARKASDGVTEYRCSVCSEWKTGFEFMIDDPLVCDLCYEEKNVSSGDADTK